MSKHAELIARLEAAEVGARELDVAIAVAFNLPPINYERAFVHGELGNYWWHPTNHRAQYWVAGDYTTSLDCALALAGRVVGGREWLVEGKDRPLGRVYRACLGIVGPVYASTPALALCIAILKALEAKA